MGWYARYRTQAGEAASVAGIIAVFVAFYLVGSHGYLLFHSLIEAMAIGIAGGIFMFAWNARRFQLNGYFLFLGLSFFFVGMLDLSHTLAYKGMGVLPVTGANEATQLWVAARALQALALLAAPLFIEKKVPVVSIIAVYVVASLLTLLGVFEWRIFPDAFIDGQGLTPFKILSEYFICATFGASSALLYRRRRHFDRDIVRLVIGSSLTMIASELAFTLYSDPYGALNALGHLLKIISYYLVYRAIIRTGLTKPVSLMFQDLKRSEENLRRVNQELDAYASTVSHDLKGPLAAIVSTADLMIMKIDRSTAPDPELRKLADTISRRGQNMAGFVNDLLSLAAAAQKPKEVATVDVDKVVRAVVADLAPALTKKNVEVRIDKDLGHITAAPAHIQQLFVNLVSNAITHNDNPRPVIEIRRLEALPDGHATYVVRDNGPGIKPEHLDKIFLPFFKGERGGHGIGLSTVEKIVKLYNGTIRAYNDGGACFEFSLEWME